LEIIEEATGKIVEEKAKVLLEIEELRKLLV